MSIFEQAEKEGTALVTLTKKNYNETISGVGADRETLAEVEQAVEQGYTVILPEKETVLNDWKGTGYLILNPETGAGAYRISGGLSGGSTSTAVTIAGVCAVIVLICLLVLLAVGIVNLLAFMYAAALGLAAQAVCALMLLLMLESYGGLAVRISKLTEAVRKQAAGDASHLNLRQAGNELEVVAYADKANERLGRKFYIMIRHGKKKNVIRSSRVNKLLCSP